MSFDDINNGADNVMYMGKYDPNMPGFEKLAPFKQWVYNFKTNPKDGMTIAHSKITQHGWAWDANAKDFEVANKSVTKFSMNKMDTQIDLAAANDKWSARFTRHMTPSDWEVDAKLFVENKCTKDWKVETAIETQSPDLGGWKLNANVNAQLDKQKPVAAKKGEWEQDTKEVAFDVCAQIDNDYSVGMAACYDTKDGLGGYKVGAGANADDNNFWLNYDIDEQQFKTGCQIKNKEKGFVHAYEVKYYGKKVGEKDKEAPAKFFWEQPVKVAAGGRYQLNKATGLSYAVEFSNTIHAQWKWDHKVDKNWKVVGHQSFNMADKDKKPYNLGFDLTYTL